MRLYVCAIFISPIWRHTCEIYHDLYERFNIKVTDVATRYRFYFSPSPTDGVVFKHVFKVDLNIYYANIEFGIILRKTVNNNKRRL